MKWIAAGIFIMLIILLLKHIIKVGDELENEKTTKVREDYLKLRK